jgi:hypothetical protein
MPVEIATHAAASQVAMIGLQRLVRIGDVVDTVWCLNGLAYSVVYDGLQFRQVCARWLPMEVNSEHKVMRMELAVKHLCRNEGEEEDTLNRIVAGDEPDFFLTCNGVLLVHFQKPGNSCQCHIALQSSADTHPGYCSCTTMPDLMQCVRPRRQFGKSNGKFLITRHRARTSPRAIFTSSVRWQNALLTNVCLTMQRVNVRCGCSYDDSRRSLTRQFIRNWWSCGTRVLLLRGIVGKNKLFILVICSLSLILALICDVLTARIFLRS